MAQRSGKPYFAQETEWSAVRLNTASGCGHSEQVVCRVRLVTFTESDRKLRPGALQGDRVVDLSDQIRSIQELLDAGPELLLSVHDALDKAHSQVSLRKWPCWHEF
jgi:hypothetical protein